MAEMTTSNRDTVNAALPRFLLNALANRRGLLDLPQILASVRVPQSRDRPRHPHHCRLRYAYCLERAPVTELHFPIFEDHSRGVYQ